MALFIMLHFDPMFCKTVSNFCALKSNFIALFISISMNTYSYQHFYTNYFPSIRKYILSNSGNQEDAEDIFQETMIVFIKKLKRDDFELTASVKTYLIAISKNLWLKQLRERKKMRLTNEIPPLLDEQVDDIIEQERNNSEKILYAMAKMTSHCKKLITDIFFRGKVIEEIQKEYGYTTRHNATNQKHKCIQQARK